MDRSFTSILSANVERTAQFYEQLLGLTRHFNSDWFIILTHPNLENHEFGILQRDHDLVPEEIRAAPSGVMITFVIENCDAAHEKAKALNAQIIHPPTNMPYGQRRMLLRDPDGTVVDISSVIV